MKIDFWNQNFVLDISDTCDFTASKTASVKQFYTLNLVSQKQSKSEFFPQILI